MAKNLHPWFYAPGNLYLTEKRISAKREKESREKIKNDEMNKYFNKCNLESKMFSNWENNKPLVRYKHQCPKEESPFYVENAITKEYHDQWREETLKRLSTLYREYKQATTNYNDNLMDSNSILLYMQNLHRHYGLMMNERASKMTEMNGYLHDDAYRTNQHDPLRHVCFLIRELLYFYKHNIVTISRLLSPIYAHGFLSDSEQADLKDVNSRCVHILTMYIQLNQVRNNHFQQMYNEEKDDIWHKQKRLWLDEIAIWDCLVVNLVRSSYHLIKDKFEHQLNTLQQFLKQRITRFDQLKFLIEEIRHDATLRDLIHVDIHKLEQL